MDLLQDHQGFLWVGTVGGLYRYDGYTFKHYPFPSVTQKEHRDSMWHNAPGAGQLLEDHNGNIWIVNTFSESPIGWLKMLDINQDTLVNLDLRMASRPVTYKRLLIEDPEGYIWVHCWDGLRRIITPGRERKPFNIKFYPIDPENSHGLTDSISSILLDRQNRLWVATFDGGLHYYDRQKDSILKIQTLSFSGIFELCQINDGPIAASSEEGLFLIDPETLQIKHFQQQPGTAHSLAGNYVRKMLPDREGRIWLFSAPKKNGPYALQRFDALTGRFSNPYMDSIFPGGTMTGFYDSPFHLFADRQGRIWVNNNKGLQLFLPEQDRFFTLRTANPTFGEGVHTFLQDNTGVIWMGSPVGLYKYSSGANRFRIFKHQADQSLSPSSDRIAAVFEDSRQYIWLGHDRGIDRVRLNKANFITEKKFFPFSDAYGFTEDRQQNIWVHSLSGKIGFIAKGDPPIVTYRSLPVDGKESTFKIAVTAINAPNKGIYIGAKGTLLHHDPSTGETQAFAPPNIDDKPVIIHGYDNQSKLWLSDTRNFIRFDPSDENFLPFPKPAYAGRFICPGDKNSMWATRGGLRLLNIETGDLIKHFYPGQGFPTGFTEGIVKDDLGQLWISSDIGLIHFNPETEEFRVFDKDSGLPADNIYSGNGFKRQNGELLFPLGENGFLLFNPRELQPDSSLAPPVITGLKLFNEPLLPHGPQGILRKSISYTESLTLAHHQNVITIEYAGLHLSNPEAISYAYRMEGVDTGWIEAGHRRVATYAGLTPGRYTFYLKATNPDGIENPEKAFLQITIRPPWWRTWWAYSLYVVGAFALIIAGYRFLLNHRLEQAEARRLAELDEVKTRLYTNITHEFRTPLTVIEGMVNQMEENPRDWFREGLRMIRRNSRKLLRLVNQLLDLRKLESNTLPLQMVHGNVINYLQYISRSFHSYAETKDIRLHFLCPFEEMMLDYDQEKLLTIISNLLANAIKFTPAGGDVYFQVELRKPESLKDQMPKELSASDYIALIVKDTGIGIPADKLPHIFDRFYQANDKKLAQNAGTGIGLALTKELVKLFKGSIEVKSTVGKGTTFTVLLPIIQEAGLQTNNFPFLKPGELSEHLSLWTSADGSGTEDGLSPSGGQEGSDVPLVLLVEDNEDVLLYLESCLTPGYRLAFARNGQQGIDQALELVPDIIISDIMMPEVDGFKLCVTLKKDMRTSHIPIILLTAKADQESKVRGLSEGADAFLTKPFDKEELLIRLQKLIELRRGLQERYAGQTSTSRTLKSNSAPLYPQEDAFLLRVQNILETHLTEEDFGIAQLCRALSMSRTQLHRKLKALTGKSTSIYLRSLRLAKAKELLENSDLNVSEAAYEVGFSSPVYFSQAFSEEYGMPPSAVKKT